MGLSTLKEPEPEGECCTRASLPILRPGGGVCLSMSSGERFNLPRVRVVSLKDTSLQWRIIVHREGVAGSEGFVGVPTRFAFCMGFL